MIDVPKQSDFIEHIHSTRRLPKLSKCILKFILLIVISMIATPALADYLGPGDRVVTGTTSVCKVVLNECRYVPAKNDWRYKRVEDWACSNEGKPWQAYPDQPSSQGCFDATAGDQYWEREDVVQEVTNTYPPATISSSLQNCSLQNGWCTASPYLSLSGSEPVEGQSILAIEGTLNGQLFACAGANCSVPLNEGHNSFAYWALSSWGDSSTMGTFTTNVDTGLPIITGSFTGTLGSNGWYIAPVSFTGNASDATSGLASFTCTLDGAALGSCNSINVNTNGLHTVVLTAQDNAAHTTTINQNISLDTQNPILNAALSGTLGTNTWYTAAQINASASDPVPGSGLAAIEYNLDNSDWGTFPTSGVLNLPRGKHSIDVRAIDIAGRTVSSSRSFWLDTIAPDVTLNPSGMLGSNSWYTTSVNLTAFASDSTSGIDLFEYSLDNRAWTTYLTPLTLADGTHGLSFWAQDKAGLSTQVDRTYKVDTRVPLIAGSLSGIPGTNSWYISDVMLSASASDPAPGSGIDAFTYILNDGAEIPYASVLTLSDGRHAIQLTAQDKAGLAYSTEQTIKVDTTYPSLNVQTTLPNWINDSVTLNGSAGDNGSGLLKVEISTDGGQIWQPVIGTTSWSYIWITQNSPNGIRDVQVRAIDNAGLTTKRSFQAGVDNRAPKISVPDSWYQWDTVTLDIWDDDSGLSEARVEISDPEGRWPARIIRLNPGRFPLDFKWDRRFGDDTIAPLGTYNLKVVTFDNLGNQARKSASIKILLDILPAGPTATPQPASRPVDTSTTTPDQTANATTTPTQTAVVSVFGATVEPPVQETPTPKTQIILRATSTQTSVLDWLQSVFVPEPNPAEHVTEVVSSVPLSASQSSGSQSNVLWGAAAAGVIGAATAYALEEKRKRKEEEARQAEQIRAEVDAKNTAIRASQQAKREALKIQNWFQGQANLNAQVEEARKQGATSAEISAIKQTGATQGFGAAIAKTANLTQSLYKKAIQKAQNAFMEAKMARLDAAEEAAWEKSEFIKAQRAEQALQDWRAGEKETYIVQPKEKTWWEKSIDWIDEHQVEIALGIGVVAGVAAVILTGGLALPALTVIAGAAVAAGATVAFGTMGLNAHYGRPWNENLARNIAIAEITAAVVSGALILFQTGTTVAGIYCARNTTACARVEPLLNAFDVAEEGWLSTKLGFQTRIGNDTGAAETAFELQLEHIDGGMPGNSIAKELGGETIEKLAQYGDDAAQIISRYGDDGIAVVQKYGGDAINLIKDHGDAAIKVMKEVDPKAAKKLLETLDDDVIDYAIQQGPDAVAVLSRWTEDDLREHGVELALRAKKDAKVLTCVKRLIALGPIDPKRLTQEQQTLIREIAANSTQYADEGQVVLGKWIDYGSGFVEHAQNTGSVHYNPHPDMWSMLGELGEQSQGQVAWLINRQVVQTGINKGIPFEYTLNGIPVKDIAKESNAVEAIFAGATNREIMETLGLDYLPIRMKELQELQKAGYEFAFDEITDSYILSLP
jgi:hypothetical protein